jgi:hypothetical protein
MGHTYGAHGIWNWKRPGDPEPPSRILRYGPTWTEALELPGAAQVALGAVRLRALPWWRLEPRPERVQLDPEPTDPTRRPAGAVAQGAAWVVYAHGAAGRPVLSGVEPLEWRAAWLDPRTGEEHAIGSARPDASALWRAPPAPSAEDWVLVLTAPAGGRR